MVAMARRPEDYMAYVVDYALLAEERCAEAGGAHPEIERARCKIYQEKARLN